MYDYYKKHLCNGMGTEIRQQARRDRSAGLRGYYCCGLYRRAILSAVFFDRKADKLSCTFTACFVNVLPEFVICGIHLPE